MMSPERRKTQGRTTKPIVKPKPKLSKPSLPGGLTITTKPATPTFKGKRGRPATGILEICDREKQRFFIADDAWKRQVQQQCIRRYIVQAEEEEGKCASDEKEKINQLQHARQTFQMMEAVMKSYRHRSDNAAA